MKPDEVVAQIREAYAKTKARPLPPVVLPEEPKQTAPREVIEEAPIELGHFHFAWHIPELRHPDVPVLDVLAVLLGQRPQLAALPGSAREARASSTPSTPGPTARAIPACSA